MSYNQDEPVAPRYDVNAPDLYIPCQYYMSLSFRYTNPSIILTQYYSYVVVMGFVTFVLASAMALGVQGRSV